jgi:hypothetical protein
MRDTEWVNPEGATHKQKMVFVWRPTESTSGRAGVEALWALEAKFWLFKRRP